MLLHIHVPLHCVTKSGIRILQTDNGNKIDLKNWVVQGMSMGVKLLRRFVKYIVRVREIEIPLYYTVEV